jgi:nitrite reductase/ring-hydroxylating ferredoxin subunit
MADDERQAHDAAERFGGYLDALLGDARPSPHDIAGADEARMARMAAELAGTMLSDPDPAFVEQLRLRVREVDEGVAAVRTSSPPRRRPGTVEPVPGGRLRVSRRALLHAGLGAAAGLAAGATGISWLRSAPPERAPVDDDRVVGGPGHWVEVARLEQLPVGEAVRFSTPEFEGYVVNDAGQIRALSSICTHLACTLQFRREQQDLRCPCHGASFDLRGELANGRGRWGEGDGYLDDARSYPIDLPPLVRPRVRIEGDQILVWIARI